ncbi:MAG: signal peptidase I [Clostridia bacterium]
MKKVFTNIINVLQKIIVVILSLVIIMNFWLIFSRYVLKQDLPSFFGYSYASVLSGSMEPEFCVGDLVVFKRQNDYEVGDVVIFSQSGSFITHRIVDTQDDMFITQGDANDSADIDLLDADNIHGAMIFSLSGMGNVQNFLAQPFGMLILVFAGIRILQTPKIFKKEERLDD